MLTYLKAWLFTHLPKSEKGQDVAEYALLIGFIALIVVLGALFLGSSVSGFFSKLGAEIATWTIGP